MKKYLSLFLIAAMVLTSFSVAFAESDAENAYDTEQAHALAVEAMKSSLDQENARIAQEMVEEGLVDADSITDVVNAAEMRAIQPTADGIHVATRKTNTNSYKEIQTMFTLGSNIGAVNGAAVYFMHYLGNGNLNVDSGIYYSAGAFRVFHYGSISAAGSWNNSNTISVSAGDTVYVNSKLSGNQIITDVIKNGSTIATLTDTLTQTYSGVGVCREFNIASQYLINNTNTYFSWSEAQSSMTTTGNVLKQMSTSNSTLQGVYYDNTSANHSNIGYNRTTTSSGGFVYDKAWCRCNFY